MEDAIIRTLKNELTLTRRRHRPILTCRLRAVVSECLDLPCRNGPCLKCAVRNCAKGLQIPLDPGAFLSGCVLHEQRRAKCRVRLIARFVERTNSAGNKHHGSLRRNRPFAARLIERRIARSRPRTDPGLGKCEFPDFPPCGAAGFSSVAAGPPPGPTADFSPSGAATGRTIPQGAVRRWKPRADHR